MKSAKPSSSKPLFDFADTFIGLTDPQFTARIDKMVRPQREELYLKAKVEYYAGNPIMTDHQFDTLENVLKAEGSKVTDKVGGAVDPGKNKLIHPHMSPMLSLGKIQVNDEDAFTTTALQELISWFPSNVYPLEATAKFDGSSIELQYKDGELKKAVTRGDNGMGQDVTAKLKTMVPQTIPSMKALEIRGEVVIPMKRFPELNMKRKQAGEKEHANPRNAAAGILNREKMTYEVEYLVFVAYHIRSHENGEVKFVDNSMQNLAKMGFNKNYPVVVRHINTPHDFIKVYQEFKKYRAEDSPFQLDGIVFKTPETHRTLIGQNNHHPKWAVALKFPSKEATTKIIDTEWEIGAFGELSPVGILHPVELDGSTVSRVSLYNKSKMESMGMFPGATVTIKKSGDIIPQIIKIVARSPKETEFITRQNYYPNACPSCKETLTLEKSKTTEHIVCNNRKCPGQNVKRLAYGISALDIKGIGESLCHDLYNSGIHNIFDFFDPKKMNAQSLCNHGVLKPGRQLQLILEGPEQLKKVDLYKVVLSLQFDRLGDTGSRQIARQKAGVSFSFDGLEKAVIEPFKNNNSVQSLSITKLVDMLRDRNVDIILPKDIASNAITFEMTGSPSSAGYKTKDELVTFLGSKGFAHAKLKDAKLLLTDSHTSSSSKMKDARKKGIKIMTYDELLATFK